MLAIENSFLIILHGKSMDNRRTNLH